MQSLKEFAMCTKRTLTIKDTYAIRQNAFALGIDERAMVEGAGFALSDAIAHSHKGKRILFVCGTGGKGALGLSAARHMMAAQDVSAVLLGDPDQVRNRSTRLNYRLLSAALPVRSVAEGSTAELQRDLKRAEVVVDAIIGCGLKGRMSSFLSGIISMINRSGAHVISIDVPSGIDADTGMPNVSYLKADHTLSVHKLKQGVERSKLVGDTVVVDIGIPISAELIAGPGDIYLATEPRLMQSSKFTNGNVLVIGGGEEYHGAPLLSAFAAEAALAALRTGAGYVTIAAPGPAAEAAKRLSAELVVKSLDWGSTVEKTAAAISSIRHDVLVIGPGMDENEVTDRHVSAIVKSEKARGNAIIVDATAIKTVARHKNLLGANAILTPHEGEFKRLSGKDLKGCTLGERARIALGFAKSHGFTLVLKGHETIITDGDLLKINMAATPALAKMGSGDVLSGIVAAYAALHKNQFECAVAGVYAHSRIGDLLYAEKGYHITANDIIDGIPDALKLFDVLRE